MPSWYATSHSGQLRLLPSALREMSTGQGAVLCGREGNRRSGVALAMRHRRWCCVLWNINQSINLFAIKGHRPLTYHTNNTNIHVTTSLLCKLYDSLMLPHAFVHMMDQSQRWWQRRSDGEVYRYIYPPKVSH